MTSISKRTRDDERDCISSYVRANQEVGRTREGKVQNYIKEASSILLGSLDDKNAEEEEIRLDELVICIKQCILERCNTDWSNLLKDLKGEEKAKEEKEFQRFTEGGDGGILGRKRDFLSVRIQTEKSGQGNSGTTAWSFSGLGGGQDL